MKQSVKITYIVLFLAIIFSVPIVQTGYEFFKNEGHRIQMLDLFQDIFITPLEKANADSRMLDSLHKNIAQLAHLNPEQTLSLCDEATIKITQLKQHVLNYNRHLEGDKNKFLRQDTITPYYRHLDKTAKDLAALSTMTSDSTLIDSARNLVLLAEKEIAGLVATQIKKTGIGGYCALVLTSLQRTMVGADYLRPFEKEMEKSSIFANTVRPWLQTAYYGAFGDMGNKGLSGVKPWLFYRMDVDYLVKPSVLDKRSVIVDANDIPIIENIVDSIVAFKKQLAIRNIDLLFVIMPTKPSIYPDLLMPGMHPMTTGNKYNSLIMMDSLRKAGVEVVDLFSAFGKERENDVKEGDPLYMETDTHFKKRGVLTTARIVAEKVRSYPWFQQGDTEYRVTPVTVQRAGDIAEMSDLPAMTKRLGRKPFPEEDVACDQVYKISRDASGNIIDSVLYKDNFRNSDILVLGDSFSRIFQTDQPKAAGWIAHLARELKQPVTSLVNDGGASTLVRQALARKSNLLKNKKLVIWEVVERDFRYGEQGWKGVTLQ